MYTTDSFVFLNQQKRGLEGAEEPKKGRLGCHRQGSQHILVLIYFITFAVPHTILLGRHLIEESYIQQLYDSDDQEAIKKHHTREQSTF